MIKCDNMRKCLGIEIETKKHNHTDHITDRKFYTDGERQVNIIQHVLIEMQILKPGSSDSFPNVCVWL